MAFPALTPRAMEQLRLAARHFRQGQAEAALAIGRRLAARYPDDIEVLHLLALIRKRLGDYDEAESLFLRCLERAPARTDLHANYGNLLAATGRLDYAVAAYVAALRNDPRFRPARLGMARVLLRQGRHAEAERETAALLESAAQDAEAWHVRGSALRGQGRLREAERAWRQALAFRPGNARARHNLATLLNEQGRSEEALAELDAAAAAGLRGPELDFGRAAALMALGRLDEAEAVTARRLDADPSDTRMHRLHARLRYMRGGSDFATRLADAVSARPDDLSLRLLQAEVLRGAGHPDEAESVLRDHRDHGTNPSLLAALAAVCQESGRYADACAHIERALWLRPEDTALQEVRVDALLSLGRAAEAMTVLDRLRARQPLNQWYIAMEATAARLLGDRRYRDYCDYDVLVREYELEPPAGWSSIEDFHADLIPVLESRHCFVAEPLDQSLRRGTQTPRNLLGDPDERIKALLRALEAPIEDYRRATGHAPRHPLRARNRGAAVLTGCWSVRLSAGGYHVNHVHSQGWISSAYYVDLPEEVRDGSARSGWLKFGEPRFDVPGAGVEKLVRPEAGKLLLFPSYMWHGTTPIHSEGRRLTVAFDVVPAEITSR